jgi:hypothetical protein
MLPVGRRIEIYRLEQATVAAQQGKVKKFL